MSKTHYKMKVRMVPKKPGTGVVSANKYEYADSEQEAKDIVLRKNPNHNIEFLEVTEA